MKRFLIRVSIWGLLCALVSFGFPYCLDPYNVFHFESRRNNGVEPNNNYIKMRHILAHPGEYDAFLFGSSRAGIINTDLIQDCKCYNFCYSEGLPKEHLDNINSLIRNGIVPKRVYMAVDSLSYTINPDDHKTQPMRMPYEYLENNPMVFYSTYLNSGTAFRSVGTIMRYTNRNKGEDNIDHSLKDDGNLVPSIGNGNYLEDCLRTIGDIKELCDQYGIEMVIFTNPMYKITYKASLERDYYDFLYRLAFITDYYNFSGLNDITVDPDNYTDTSHYKEAVSEIMLSSMLENTTPTRLKQDGFGVHVTKDNIDELLETLKNNDLNEGQN